ncbi:hypothetical protein [Sagittula sp. S175]|uniref:hypothetical protein n=1 Tax=Sagittula sp. S175 TaxID=3415129 RepID=UPI003C7C813C
MCGTFPATVPWRVEFLSVRGGEGQGLRFWAFWNRRVAGGFFSLGVFQILQGHRFNILILLIFGGERAAKVMCILRGKITLGACVCTALIHNCEFVVA